MATGKIKAQLRDEEKEINEDLNSIIDQLSSGGTTPGHKQLLMHKLDDLRRLKRSLVDKIGKRLELRTSRKWYNEGELSNKYFFNILNRKANYEVELIINEEGNLVSDKIGVETEIRNFYKISITINLFFNSDLLVL